MKVMSWMYWWKLSDCGLVMVTIPPTMIATLAATMVRIVTTGFSLAILSTAR